MPPTLQKPRNKTAAKSENIIIVREKLYFWLRERQGIFLKRFSSRMTNIFREGKSSTQPRCKAAVFFYRFDCHHHDFTCKRSRISGKNDVSGVGHYFWFPALRSYFPAAAEHLHCRRYNRRSRPNSVYCDTVLNRFKILVSTKNQSRLKFYVISVPLLADVLKFRFRVLGITFSRK